MCRRLRAPAQITLELKRSKSEQSLSPPRTNPNILEPSGRHSNFCYVSVVDGIFNCCFLVLFPFFFFFNVLHRKGDCSNDIFVVPFVLLQICGTLETWGGFSFSKNYFIKSMRLKWGKGAKIVCLIQYLCIKYTMDFQLNMACTFCTWLLASFS